MRRPASVFANGFTPRELQTFQLMGMGLRNKQISARLGVKPETARNWVERVLQKTRCQNRTEAVVWGIWMGILDLEMCYQGIEFREDFDYEVGYPAQISIG